MAPQEPLSAALHAQKARLSANPTPAIAQLCAQEVKRLVLLEPDAQSDAAAMSALRDVLATLAGPGRNHILCATTNALMARGITHPAVIGSAMQGLIDVAGMEGGSPLAALALQEKYAAQDDGAHKHWITVRGLAGRAYKDLFIDALEADPPNTDRATAFGHRALESFEHAWALAETFVARGMGEIWMWQWPLINLLSISHRMMAEGLAPPPEHATQEAFTTWQAGRADRLRGLLRDELTGPASKRTPWTVGTAAELSFVTGEDAETAEAYLEEFMDLLRKGRTDKNANADFQLFGVVRQWTKLLKPAAPALKKLQSGLPLLIFGRDGTDLSISAESIRTLLAPGGPQASAYSGLLEANYGGHDVHEVHLLRRICEAAQSVGAVKDGLGARFGTGFVVTYSEMFGNTDETQERPVFVTAAHVVGWPEKPYDDRRFCQRAALPDAVTVEFEAWRPGQNFKLRPLLTAAEDCRAKTWLDVSVLEIIGAGIEQVPTLKLAHRKKPKSGKVYVVGHPEGGPLKTPLGSNSIKDVAPPETGGDDLLYYDLTTEKGSSGSPILELPEDGAPAEVLALHFSASDKHSANKGAWIMSVKDAMQRLT